MHSSKRRPHAPVACAAACLPFGLLCLSMVVAGPKERSEFQVLWRDKGIGRVVASRTIEHDRTEYHMTSRTEFDLLWSRVVDTELRVTYTAGTLARCVSAVRVNGSLRDSTHMDMAQPGCYVHPERLTACTSRTQWTTARMYFEEPRGRSLIYVESLLSDRPLTSDGPGRYQLSFPDGHVNTYVYRQGRLFEVHVDRGFFELVFRRM